MTAANKQARSPAISGYFPAIVALSVLYCIVYAGLTHFAQRHLELEMSVFSRKAENLVEMMIPHADAEHYWVQTLTADFQSSPDHDEFRKSLHRHRSETGNRLECVVWNEKGQVVENSHFKRVEVSDELLTEAFNDLKKIYETGKNFPQSGLKKLQSILGPHLEAEKLAAALYFRHKRFLRPDLAGHYPDLWVAWSPKFAAMVFFDKKQFNEDMGLIQFARKNSTIGCKIGFTKPSDDDFKMFDAAVRKLEHEGRSAVQVNGILIAGKRISENRILIATRRFEPIFHPGRLASLVAVVGIFVLTLFLRGNGFGLDRRSVKLQILIMLAVTTGLPLLLLALAASDHVSRKRNSLIENAYQSCIGYIQHIDKRSLTMHSSIIHKVNRFIPEIKKELPQNFGSSEMLAQIQRQMGDSLLFMRLVASSPAKLMSESGILDGNRFIAYEKGRKQLSKTLLDLKISRDIAAGYMAEINGSSAGNILTETELVAEMVYQRPFHEIIQNMMLATDRIFLLGLIDRTSPLLVKLISLKNNAVIDYFLMLFFQNRRLQEKFLSGNSGNFARNPLGIRFIFSDANMFNLNGKSFSHNEWFAEIYFKTREHPAVDPCITTIAGHEYVYAGMRAKNLDIYSLFAFYPLEKIEAQIAEEKNFMLSAGLMTLVMLFGLGIIFSTSFVLPLSELRNGAIAIRSRDFSFRLSESAKDEFGEMARIFNASIADFEELSLAGIVQARLLPQKGISDPRFELYGKNIPMTELGGDYFDYFMADEGRYVIMAGDVAGHGVGASLIMAMAKAGILRCRDCLHDPASVLARLHQIVHETRTRSQRKVMTFQYLYYNAETGVGTYSNAGACSPVLVDKTNGLTREINLQGAVLGGFKKTRFSNTDLQLSPGQALVFYTDGIIETINSAGKEIGYDGFRQMLLDCYDPDARCFYDKVFMRYLQWLGNRRPQDDVTLIILVRNYR